MPHFRAYRIDDAGKFMDFAEFEAADDHEALAVVRASTEELCFQVWAGARFVGHVDNGNRYVKARLLQSEPFKSAAE